MGILKAPNGLLIVATLETVPGTCGIIGDDVRRCANGSIEFEYDGSGTNMDWDRQKTVTRPVMVGDGRQFQRVFVDEDGGEHLECDLVIVDEEEEESEA